MKQTTPPTTRTKRHDNTDEDRQTWTSVDVLRLRGHMDTWRACDRLCRQQWPQMERMVRSSFVRLQNAQRGHAVVLSVTPPLTPFPKNTMERTINELAVAAKLNEAIGRPSTAMDALAREMSLIKLFKGMSDEEMSRIAQDAHYYPLPTK